MSKSKKQLVKKEIQSTEVTQVETLQIKVHYYRLLDSDLEAKKKKGPPPPISRLTYGRSQWRLCPKGGVTVALAVNEDDVIRHEAIARCSMADNFNRKVGRKIAVGRLLKKMLTEMEARENEEIQKANPVGRF